jgi:hypothetical protein
MTFEDLTLLSRRGRVRLAALVLALVAMVIWASAHFLQPAPPRHIVMASGLEDGLPHALAQRYIAILARSGVTIEERLTHGAGENIALLQDAHSGVDIAFTQGGVARFPAANDVVMLASLYYVPMWIFYTGADTISQINHLRSRKVAVGVEGVEPARSRPEGAFSRRSLGSVGRAGLRGWQSRIRTRRLGAAGHPDAAGHVDVTARNQSVDVLRNVAGHWLIIRSINYPDKP